MSSRWSGTLVTSSGTPALDLPAYVGQRTTSYRFDVVDRITGYRRAVTPASGTVPVLTHDTQRTIKRELTNLFLDVEDTRHFNVVTSLVEPFMIVDDVEYPLGQYMPNSQTRVPSTSGTRSFENCYDLGFIIDQQVSLGIGASIPGESLQVVTDRFLSRYPIRYTIESSPYGGTVAWSIGTMGGFICEQLALNGDWFPPWFDHTGVMRWIRTFDVATSIPTFNFDDGYRVLRSSVTHSDNLITAPNRFIMVSNGASSVGDAEVIGVYTVPDSAPHSIANRGFEIPHIEFRQLDSQVQAEAVARSVAQQTMIFELAKLTTPPDPRHESFDVVRWRGENWLELSWSLPLTANAAMQHTLKKVYS